MHWYYTEGHLTIKIDDEEHKFSLEELISNSLVYKERRKKVFKVFIIFLLLIGGLQYIGGGMPVDKDIYFYIGYISTPIILASLFSFVSHLYLRYVKKQENDLDSIFKENINI